MARFDRLSRALLITTKEIDSTRTASHDLLLRGGFIKQSSQGMYTLLPFGLRVLEKLERIIDKELSQISNKISMPCLLSAKYWKKTKRFETNETFKVFDRKKAEFLLAPTHEEEVTTLIDSLVTSYRQLPLSVYQIGKKYRDEMRPRSGLLRAKEFVMKDMYSFHTSEQEALDYYDIATTAYHNILQQLKAEADTGNIGGTRSHEYQILSPNGEDTVLVCTGCSYSANVEKAVGKIASIDTSKPTLTSIPHKNGSMLELLDVIQSKLQGNAKAEILVGPKGPVLLLVPENRSINETKLLKNANLESLLVASIEKDNRPVQVVIDEQVMIKSHGYQVADIINTEQGDMCKSCHSPLETHRAIEVAHTFYLGTKYSKALEATFKSPDQSQIPFQMGCYGIGVSRLIAAVIEASHDANGMIWPKSIAPYQLCVIHIPKDPNGNLQSQFMDQLSIQLPRLFQDNDVILDDRDVSFGFKMKDAQLVGYPHILVVGKSFYEDGQVELHHRTKGKQLIPLKDVLDQLS